MAEYVVVVASIGKGTSAPSGYLELHPPSGEACAIKRLRVSCNEFTTVFEDRVIVKVYRTSTAGSAGTAYTPIPIGGFNNSAGRSSSTSAKINTSQAPWTPGTITDTVLQCCFHAQGNFEWV